MRVSQVWPVRKCSFHILKYHIFSFVMCWECIAEMIFCYASPASHFDPEKPIGLGSVFEMNQLHQFQLTPPCLQTYCAIMTFLITFLIKCIINLSDSVKIRNTCMTLTVDSHLNETCTDKAKAKCNTCCNMTCSTVFIFLIFGKTLKRVWNVVLFLSDKWRWKVPHYSLSCWFLFLSQLYNMLDVFWGWKGEIGDNETSTWQWWMTCCSALEQVKSDDECVARIWRRWGFPLMDCGDVY
jgi:hypothetical protein